MTVPSYSTTPSSNNAAPPNGAPEGMTPGSVNDVIRQMMADTAVEAQVNRVKYLNSVSGTNTITASMTPALTAYSAGMIVVLTPAGNNTGATTLNISTLGALDIQKFDGDALVSGDLVAGIPAMLVLDSGADDWILLNPQTGDIPAATILSRLLTVDGSGSGLDTDLLDGQDSAYYRNASNLNAGSVPSAQIAQASVTQHQSALAIAASQVTSGTFADARVAASNVTQHARATVLAASTIQADPGGTPSGSPGQLFLYY